MTFNFAKWEILTVDTDATKASGLPRAIISQSGVSDASRLPPELRLLLPIHQDSDVWRSELVNCIAPGDDTAVAVFMADPFLNVMAFAAAAQACGVRWVCNLPTTAQHDAEFLAQLMEVGLDHSKELGLLTRFRENGLKSIASVGSTDQAVFAHGSGADALLVLPQVQDYRAGFPSTLHRQTRVADIRAAIGPVDVPILSLVPLRERAHPALWPRNVDGVVVQPEVNSAG